MIISTHRFHGRGSLRFVYQQGKVVRSPQLLLRYCVNGRRKTYRTAVVVSRKVHKSAVVRNRIRRRIYEVIRNHEVGITEPYDLVFIALQESIRTMAPTELTQLIEQQLEKAGVLHLSLAQSHGIVNKE